MPLVADISRKRIVVLGLLLPVLLLIVGAIIYLQTPLKSTAVVETAEVTSSVTGKEGSLQTVTTPPKLFNGKLSPEASSMEAFSSNPKRDPEEQQVLDIAGERGVPDHAKVERLLALLPSLTPDAQTVAMENATALIPDKDYLTYRERLLKLASTPDLRVAVMDDSLTRGEELRLPNLLELMRSSTSEEEKKEIREIFEAYLDKDYGPDPMAWEAPLKTWVAENSDS